MKRNPATIMVVGLLGITAAADCNGNGAGRADYVTRKEFEELRSQYVATHDTMLSLWKGTDSLNAIFGGFISGRYGKFPVPPPPRCPPNCEDLIPRAPLPIETRPQPTRP
jgi:hypothetical protein